MLDSQMQRCIASGRVCLCLSVCLFACHVHALTFESLERKTSFWHALTLSEYTCLGQTRILRSSGQGRGQRSYDRKETSTFWRTMNACKQWKLWSFDRLEQQGATLWDLCLPPHLCKVSIIIELLVNPLTQWRQTVTFRSVQCHRGLTYHF